MSEKIDKDKMLEGIKKILGFDTYEQVKAQPDCIHQSDGHIYGEAALYNILRCGKCGVHYEQYFH